MKTDNTPSTPSQADIAALAMTPQGWETIKAALRQAAADTLVADTTSLWHVETILDTHARLVRSQTKKED